MNLPDASPETSVKTMIIHVFRVLFGPGLLGALGASLLVNSSPFASPANALFLIVAVALIASAYLDRSTFSGKPLPPGPAGLKVRLGYVASVLAVAALFQILAHAGGE